MYVHGGHADLSHAQQPCGKCCRMANIAPLQCAPDYPSLPLVVATSSRDVVPRDGGHNADTIADCTPFHTPWCGFRPYSIWRGTRLLGTAVQITRSSNGTLISVVTDQGNVAVYDRESPQMVDSTDELIAGAQLTRSGAVLSPDGARLCVALSSTNTGACCREVRVFDTATWEEIDRFDLGFEAFGWSVAVDSPDSHSELLHTYTNDSLGFCHLLRSSE